MIFIDSDQIQHAIEPRIAKSTVLLRLSEISAQFKLELVQT